MNIESLIEQVVSAFRARVGGTVQASEAWHDLPEDRRLEAYEATLRTRRLEAATDPDGLSTTAHAILARIR